MAQPTLEDHLMKQRQQVDLLMTATSLVKSKDNIMSELGEAQSQTSGLKTGLESAKLDLETMKKHNERMKVHLEQLIKLKEQIQYMESNIPPKLLHDYAEIQLKESRNVAGRILKEITPSGQNLEGELPADVFYEDNKNVENCKKILFNEPRVFKKIRLIGSEEFEGIPKYMIGRHTIDSLNNFVNIINEVLEAKYSLMALGQNGARKKGELNLYLNFKKQENTLGKGKGKVYFFVAEDYHRHTKTKLDKTKLNLLTVLRHCKRLQEARTSKEIHYIVVSPSHN